MNFQSLHLLMLPLILLLTIPHSHCAWKPYTRFIGYIPSYTYPITLNAGDTLRGFLTWPGTQDLDIYLYRSGMDLLSRSTYLDRQFSPTLNPEDLVYTIPATDLYYLRVDLYSSVPTPYQFQIYVNGQIISTFFDTVITVTSGRTAQQFSVTGPCQIRVKYDGPVYNIYLFTPGTNVITGSPVASDTTAVNPKYITHLLTSGGLWNIVIHHGLTSTTTLTPFEIVVETELGANECLNLCSGIPYSEGIIYGLTSTCDCQTGFSWISSNQTCSIDCPSFNTSGVTGNRINSTADQCQCTNPAFTWNTTYLMCVVDCNLVPFANGPDGNQSCLCRSGFEWDSATLLCVKNCSSFAFTAGVSAMNVSECDCINSFYWDPSLSACFINCTSIPYTTYSAVNLVWFCLCQSNFYWNSFTHECNIDCTAFSGVLPIVINGTVDVCQCVLSNRMWNSSTFECQLNCSSIEYSSGLQNTNSCLCENKFAWNPAQQKCVIGCDALNYTVSPYWVINSTNSCQCLDGYIWDATSLLCFINCSAIEYATTLAPNSTDQCLCEPSFYWSPQPPLPDCLIDCSLFNNTQGGVAGWIDGCNCRYKYSWDNTSFSCIISCPEIANTASNTTFNVSAGGCACTDKFNWDPFLEQCVIDCTSLNHTLFSVNGSFDRCLCVTGYFWAPTTLSCELTDSTLPQISNASQFEWVNNDCCTRQIFSNIKLQPTNPISGFTYIQLLQKNQQDGQYYTSTNIIVENAEYNISDNSVKLTIALISDPIPSFAVQLSNPAVPTLQPVLTVASLPTSIATAYYSASECQTSKSVKNIVKFLPIAAYFVMGAGVSTFSPKLVGLQFMGVLQLAYFSVSQHYEAINAYIYELVGLKMANGANFPIYQQNAEGFYSNIPAVIRKDAKINGYFINNFNIMYLILQVFGLAFFALYIFLLLYRNFLLKKEPEQQLHNSSNQKLSNPSAKTQGCSAATLQPYVLAILKQGIVTILFFSLFNISYSALIFYRYCKEAASNGSALALSQIGFYMTVLITVGVLVDLVRAGSASASYGEFKQLFKLNWVCRMYVPISILYRITIGAMMAAKVEDMYSTLFVMFIAGAFLMFNIVNLPFKSVLHNYRANFIHLTQLITLFVANYYRSMKANSPLQLKSHIHAPALILIACLTISAVFSLLVILYEIGKKTKALIGKCKKSKIENLDKDKIQSQEPQMSSKREMSRANNINITQDELHGNINEQRLQQTNDQF